MLPGLSRWLVLAGTIIIADFVSKAWVLSVFHLHESRAVTSFFNLVLVFNPGASFSFLADAGGWQRWFLIVLALAISAWLVVMIRQHARERLLPFALTLVLGGALGNVIDRLRFGAVVDFLDFHVAGWHWPAFNVADVAIVGGVVLLLWQQLTHKENGSPHD
ncbi:MAG: signal peptidase II [Rhodocyclaceae bacterium]